MNETHDDTLLIRPEPGVHDGCFLYTKPRCPVKVAELNARLAALPEVPSESYKLNTWLMGFIHPIQSEGEYREMMATIDELRKVWKGEDECKTTNLKTSLDQQSSTSNQPEAMTTTT